MSNTHSQSESRPFTVFVTDRAEADLEAAYLYLSQFIGPERSLDWFNGFQQAIHDLGRFPGPFANAIDEDATTRQGYEIRRLLYSGPKRRVRGPTYHAFYTVIPPKDDHEGTIRVVHIRHGSAGPVEHGP